MGLFNKDKVPPEQGGMFDGILASLLARYGVTQEHIDKVKTVLDMVEISEKEIVIKTSSSTVKIAR